MGKWKPIIGFEKYYLISDFGNIKTTGRFAFGHGGLKFKKSKFLSKVKTKQGYLRTSINNDGEKRKSFLIHRLVAEAFLPNPNGKLFINHIDGNKSNNNLNNLEWCTSSENQKHAYDILNKTPTNGERQHLSKLTSFDITLIRNCPISDSVLSKHYAVSRATLLNIKKRITWKHIH